MKSVIILRYLGQMVRGSFWLEERYHAHRVCL